MKNNYNIEKIIDSLMNKGHTNFLCENELNIIKGKLKNNEFKVFKLYEDSSKSIIYKKTIPPVKLFKIVSEVALRHQDILGTIFSLGLKEDTFGDITKYNDEYYLFTLPNLADYFTYNLTTIRNNPVKLIEVNLNISANFKQEYFKKEYIVSSLRIDNVISTVIGDSRSNILTKFKNKEVILNYKEELKPTRLLKEGDVFSIKKYGKYKYNGIIKKTKKGSFIIEILTYR